MDDTATMLEINNLNKYYGMGNLRLHVLTDVSLNISKGEICSVVGKSGAGKSTLLNCVGCLDYFQSGSLKIAGKQVAKMSIEELSSFRNRKMGFIFQMHNLLPEFTALENVMLPLMIRRMSKRKAKKLALESIAEFDLLDRLNHKPSELSGGECQRIAVARAIVGNPELILADEPTGSLDSKNSENLIEILFKLGKERNTTIVVVTHDKAIASKTERTIELLDGKINSDVKNWEANNEN